LENANNILQMIWDYYVKVGRQRPVVPDVANGPEGALNEAVNKDRPVPSRRVTFGRRGGYRCHWCIRGSPSASSSLPQVRRPPPRLTVRHYFRDQIEDEEDCDDDNQEEKYQQLQKEGTTLRVRSGLGRRRRWRRRCQRQRQLHRGPSQVRIVRECPLRPKRQRRRPKGGGEGGGPLLCPTDENVLVLQWSVHQVRRRHRHLHGHGNHRGVYRRVQDGRRCSSGSTITSGTGGGREEEHLLLHIRISVSRSHPRKSGGGGGSSTNHARRVEIGTGRRRTVKLPNFR